MIPPSFIVGGVGVALLIATAGYAKIQGERLETAQAERDALKAQVSSCLASVERQNQAVKSLQDASREAGERAQKLLDEVRRAGRASKGEIERLKGVKPAGTSCPAGEAVSKVRQGLTN